MLDAGKSLCSLLKMVFTAFPLEAPDAPQDVKMLYQRVEDLIQKHLAAVTAPQISLETGSANAVISFILFVVKSLTEVQTSFVDPFIVPLVRVLQRLMRDVGSSSGSHVRQVLLFFRFALMNSVHNGCIYKSFAESKNGYRFRSEFACNHRLHLSSFQH